MCCEKDLWKKKEDINGIFVKKKTHKGNITCPPTLSLTQDLLCVADDDVFDAFSIILYYFKVLFKCKCIKDHN